jgi:methionyl aminopeptidase
MKSGMSFTIEPILTEGKNEIGVWPDNWTAATIDGSW